MGFALAALERAGNEYDNLHFLLSDFSAISMLQRSLSNSQMMRCELAKMT